jgi:hypothetical protein
MPIDDDFERERLAAEAFEHIRAGHHWADWVVIAAGFDVGRRKAMQIAATSVPRGRRYNEAFSIWLHDPCRSDWTLGIDQVTRSQLLWVHDNLTEIKSWRETLQTQQRLKWNHPSVVKVHFERHKRGLDAKPRPRGKGSRPKHETAPQPPHPVHMLHHLAQRWEPRQIEGLELDDDEVQYLSQDAPWVLPALNTICEMHGIDTGLRSPESSEIVDLQPTFPSDGVIVRKGLPAPPGAELPWSELLEVVRAVQQATSAGHSQDDILGVVYDALGL